MSVLKILQQMLQIPDLASKKWIYEQYDSQVMNDTIQTGGDASVVRIHNTKKALAISTDCTPRYVEADPYLGSIQAVCETYRNICAVGAKPLAITNCLNFGNPQKPEIMGQIVRSIRGITAACKALNYPVVSGNVSLYNETDGKAIQPTPAIGGVGLLSDQDFMVKSKFKNLGDLVFLIGEAQGHLPCSLFYRDILGIEKLENPPSIDFDEEQKNGDFIRNLAEKKLIGSCHDISDGGLLTSLFEMGSDEFGCKLKNPAELIEAIFTKNHSEFIKISDKISQKNCQNFADLKNPKTLAKYAFWFGEEQSRYLISINPSQKNQFLEIAQKQNVKIAEIGEVIKKELILGEESAKMHELIKLNCELFAKKFG